MIVSTVCCFLSFIRHNLKYFFDLAEKDHQRKQDLARKFLTEENRLKQRWLEFRSQSPPKANSRESSRTHEYRSFSKTETYLSKCGPTKPSQSLLNGQSSPLDSSNTMHSSSLSPTRLRNADPKSPVRKHISRETDYERRERLGTKHVRRAGKQARTQRELRDEQLEKLRVEILAMERATRSMGAEAELFALAMREGLEENQLVAETDMIRNLHGKALPKRHTPAVVIEQETEILALLVGCRNLAVPSAFDLPSSPSNKAPPQLTLPTSPVVDRENAQSMLKIVISAQGQTGLKELHTTYPLKLQPSPQWPSDFLVELGEGKRFISALRFEVFGGTSPELTRDKVLDRESIRDKEKALASPSERTEREKKNHRENYLLGTVEVPIEAILEPLQRWKQKKASIEAETEPSKARVISILSLPFALRDSRGMALDSTLVILPRLVKLSANGRQARSTANLATKAVMAGILY